MIPGGDNNFAWGASAFAAGHNAKAVHNYAFVWADGGISDFSSFGANSFSVRATGGTRFYSGAATGVELAAGSGGWSSLSDRNAKENVQPVDSRALLDKLAALPMGTWNYKEQDSSIRHIGPMAQDFRAAFGVGEDERHINTVDADGVALAAIQGLNEKVEDGMQRAEGRNRKSEERIQKLEAENAELKNAVNELQELVQTMNHKLNRGAK